MGPDFLQDKLHLSLDRKFLSKKARLIRRCLRYTIPLYSAKTEHRSKTSLLLTTYDTIASLLVYKRC